MLHTICMYGFHRHFELLYVPPLRIQHHKNHRFSNGLPSHGNIHLVLYVLFYESDSHKLRTLSSGIACLSSIPNMYDYYFHMPDFRSQQYH